MYTGVHTNVSQESYSFELFDPPLDTSLIGMGNKPGICGLCISVDSFDLMFESVMFSVKG